LVDKSGIAQETTASCVRTKYTTGNVIYEKEEETMDS
jgi:hypothetical protein